MRPLTKEDVTERYLRWLSDPITTRFIETASATNAREELTNYVAERSNRPDILFLGIFVRATGEHIGNIKYEPINLIKKYAVMGILIGQPEWRGKAVAPEVIGETAKWLKDTIGLTEIVLGVEKENMPGIRAYENCGFKIASTEKIEINSEIAVGMVLDLRSKTVD